MRAHPSWLGRDARFATDQGELQNWLTSVLEAPGPSAPRLTVAGALVPGSFAAYVRLFHPIRSPREGSLTAWRDIAFGSSLRLTPELTFDDISGQGVLDRQGNELFPLAGSLSIEQSLALAELLNGPGEVVFAFWLGYAGIRDLLPEEGRGSDVSDTRECVFLEGSLEAVSKFWFAEDIYMSPTFWFPRGELDWFVSSHPDYSSTYVGCDLTTAMAIDDRSMLESVIVEGSCPPVR